MANAIFTHRGGLGGLANIGTKGFLDSFVTDPLQGTIRFPSLTEPPGGVESFADITMRTARLNAETAAHFERTASLMLDGARLLRQENPQGPFDLPLAATGGEWSLAYYGSYKERDVRPTVCLKKGYERTLHLTREREHWDVSIEHRALLKHTDLSMAVNGDKGMAMTHWFALSFMGEALGEARKAVGLDPESLNHGPLTTNNTSVAVLHSVLRDQYSNREAIRFERQRGTGDFVSLPADFTPPSYTRLHLCRLADPQGPDHGLWRAEFSESERGDSDMLRIFMHRLHKESPALWGLNPALIGLWQAAGGIVPEELAG